MNDVNKSTDHGVVKYVGLELRTGYIDDDLIWCKSTDMQIDNGWLTINNPLSTQQLTAGTLGVGSEITFKLMLTSIRVPVSDLRSMVETTIDPFKLQKV